MGNISELGEMWMGGIFFIIFIIFDIFCERAVIWIAPDDVTGLARLRAPVQVFGEAFKIGLGIIWLYLTRRRENRLFLRHRMYTRICIIRSIFFFFLKFYFVFFFGRVLSRIRHLGVAGLKISLLFFLSLFVYKDDDDCGFDYDC